MGSVPRSQDRGTWRLRHLLPAALQPELPAGLFGTAVLRAAGHQQSNGCDTGKSVVEPASKLGDRSNAHSLEFALRWSRYPNRGTDQRRSKPCHELSFIRE